MPVHISRLATGVQSDPGTWPNLRHILCSHCIPLPTLGLPWVRSLKWFLRTRAVLHLCLSLLPSMQRRPGEIVYLIIQHNVEKA